MQKIKEFLLTSLGAFGHLLFLVLNALLMLINMLPLYVLDAPLWIILLVGLLIYFVPFLQLPYLVVWIWAFVVAVRHPINWLSVVYFVACGLYLLYLIFALLPANQHYD